MTATGIIDATRLTCSCHESSFDPSVVDAGTSTAVATA
jgi:hypothetical protein